MKSKFIRKIYCKIKIKLFNSKIKYNKVKNKLKRKIKIYF